MFVFRHMQADELLHFPDLGDGDLSREQRREALLDFVNVQRPLAALVIFLNVVALEDLFRDLGARLADIADLQSFFPDITGLRMVPLPPKTNRPFRRLDMDPAPLTDFAEVNGLYRRCLNIEPIPVSEFPKLYDLALIRHTVAHNGSVVRQVDAGRFKYWEMRPGQFINPPVEFVKETARYLYSIGRSFETAIQDRVFTVALSCQPDSWPREPSPLVLTLIETFNYLGKILRRDAPLPILTDPNYEQKVRLASEEARKRLNEICLAEVVERFQPSS
ncbi:MAG: hypothetical protein WEB59_09825 [Thermoanaerobaculia bacterium]